MSPAAALSRAYDVVLRDGSTLHLRPLAPGDAGALEDLRARAEPPDYVDRFRAMADGTGLALVGEVGGRLQGGAAYRPVPARPGYAEVVVVVAPALQGRGVATRFVEILADAARTAGLATFEGRVRPDNARLIDLFASSGFALEERREGEWLILSMAIAETPAFLERSAARAQQAAAASLRAFFAPASVAIVGASRTRGKIGSEVLHNVREAGFCGPVYPIHPGGGVIDGLAAFARLTDVPGPVDLVVVSVPAAAVPAVVADGLAKGVKGFVVITAGFSEAGAEGRAREAAILDAVRRAGVRMVGPNCMGLLNTDPAVRLNATFSPVYPPAGRVAMSTQSGALGLAILDYAQRLNIGISTFVSVGNKADISSNDLIQYWADDPRTDVILLYLESFGNPRKFSDIARRVARHKPIVAVKSGRSQAGARAASSHTGALASSDVIVDALFRQAGVIRTDTLEELFDVAALVAHQPVPRGRRVAILTNAGGPGILAADACEAQGLTLPPLGDRTVETLRSFLPAAASVANPVDMIASATPDQYGRALVALLADEGVDSVLVIFIPPLVTAADDVARAVRAAAEGARDKPVLAVFMSAHGAPVRLAPIPAYTFPEAAAVALARVVRYGEWRGAPAGETPALARFDAARARVVIDDVLRRGGGWMTPPEAQALLAAIGVAAARSEVAATDAEAVSAARRIGFPVVLKAIGPAIVHKTEVGGVRLGLATADAVRDAWRDLAGRLGEAMTGVQVQEMVAGGVEMLAGITEDSTFGAVVVCGSGGVLTELVADAELRLCPLTDREAQAMIDGLRGAALLRGHRGAPPADEAALADVLLRLSALAMLGDEIAELDINPLKVLSKGAVAVDARVRVERPRARPASRRVTY